MSQVYVISSDGATKPMNRVRCLDEDKELQRILEKNPDLLPGDKIDPDDPRRWLLIKREMPVPDPSTGSDRWSIDFVFADQSAIPTFVECKRYADTRSRREVVGQMLEYVANGHYYWTKDELQSYAEAAAEARGTKLADAVQSLRPDDNLSADEFFSRLQENLREAQVRIVFFLEEAPSELKSVVDFLNKQMERSEVLLVEARQYSLDGLAVVAPALFGFTEQARQVKRRVNVAAGPKTYWDESSFFKDAERQLALQEVNALHRVLDQCRTSGLTIRFGTGTNAWVYVYCLEACTASFLSFTAKGDLCLNFYSLKGKQTAEELRDYLQQAVVSRLQLSVPEDYVLRTPSYTPIEWVSKVDVLIEVLQDLAKTFAPGVPK